MTDLSKLAAQRCAELVDRDYWPARDFLDDAVNPEAITFREFVERAHTLAQQAIADPSNAATILAPLVLMEPIDPVEERAREVWERARAAFDLMRPYATLGANKAIAIIANALRQGADHAIT